MTTPVTEETAKLLIEAVNRLAAVLERGIYINHHTQPPAYVPQWPLLATCLSSYAGLHRMHESNED